LIVDSKWNFRLPNLDEPELEKNWNADDADYADLRGFFYIYPRKSASSASSAFYKSLPIGQEINFLDTNRLISV